MKGEDCTLLFVRTPWQVKQALAEFHFSHPMGGGDSISSLAEDLSPANAFSETLSSISCSSMKILDGTGNEQNGLVSGEFDDMGSSQSFFTSEEFEANSRRRQAINKEILHSYEGSQLQSKDLEEAKRKILRYTPGAWIENVGGLKLSDYDVPNTTSLLLVGPGASGKSSLVNKISRVFEDDKFMSVRAQVSYNSSVGDGTCFLQEYMIPRNSASFCIYDTRSLSNDCRENHEILKKWMNHGVRHGEFVVRKTDDFSFRARVRCCYSQIRKVNFVIFVVNGLSVLISMESPNDWDKNYTDMIASTFKCPYISFKDDKPVVAVTHGDLLSLSDRARVSAHLGELLGIPPTKQIFDIPDSDDPITELAIIDLLCYSLEHADRNLSLRNRMINMVHRVSSSTFAVLLILLGLAIAFAVAHLNINSIYCVAEACTKLIHASCSKFRKVPKVDWHVYQKEKPMVDWHEIRHIW